MNINNITNNSVNFGWYITIHNNITKNAGKKSGISPEILKKIAFYSFIPDLDETLMFRQKHFFYPTQNKSFLDITKKRNAKYTYTKHLEKMKEAFSSGNQNKVINEAGRALHYLQDMTQPMHLEEGTFFQKLKNAIFPHFAFEIKTHNIQNIIYKHLKPSKIKATTLDELFEETLKLTKTIDIPTKINKEYWSQIAQKSLNITTASTEKFLKLIKNYLK